MSTGMPDDCPPVVALYRRCIEVCLIGGIRSACGWGSDVRNRILPILTDHLKLRHYVGVLEDCTSSQNGITEREARDLYNTASQATHEAAAILRQEADVLEQNLERYRHNLSTAQSFRPLAIQALDNAMASADRLILDAATAAMQRTANLTGSDNTPLFDEREVLLAIRRQGERILGNLHRMLSAELAAMQGRISARGYTENTYGGDSQPISASQLPSLNSPGECLGSRLQEVPTPRNLPAPSEPVSLMEAGRWVRDELARATGWFPERTGAEKQRDKRQPMLDACLAALEAEAADYKQRLIQAAEAAITEQTATLSRDVQRSFDRNFANEAAAEAKISLWRNQVRSLRLPPPLLFNMTRILQKWTTAMPTVST